MQDDKRVAAPDTAASRGTGGSAHPRQPQPGQRRDAAGGGRLRSIYGELVASPAHDDFAAAAPPPPPPPPLSPPPVVLDPWVSLMAGTPAESAVEPAAEAPREGTPPPPPPPPSPPLSLPLPPPPPPPSPTVAPTANRWRGLLQGSAPIPRETPATTSPGGLSPSGVPGGSAAPARPPAQHSAKRRRGTQGTGDREPGAAEGHPAITPAERKDEEVQPKRTTGAQPAVREVRQLLQITRIPGSPGEQYPRQITDAEDIGSRGRPEDLVFRRLDRWSGAAGGSSRKRTPRAGGAELAATSADAAVRTALDGILRNQATAVVGMPGKDGVLLFRNILQRRFDPTVGHAEILGATKLAHSIQPLHRKDEEDMLRPPAWDESPCALGDNCWGAICTRNNRFGRGGIGPLRAAVGLGDTCKLCILCIRNAQVDYIQMRTGIQPGSVRVPDYALAYTNLVGSPGEYVLDNMIVLGATEAAALGSVVVCSKLRDFRYTKKRVDPPQPPWLPQTLVFLDQSDLPYPDETSQFFRQAPRLESRLV